MGTDALDDVDRLRALAGLGLGPRPDVDMEYFARRTRDLVGVPIALVSLVWSDRQVFPGQCGLPEPWASTREMPLTRSLCRRVVASGEPVVIEDARTVAIGDLGVVGYAGMPLTDVNGTVLGALCAIDTEPHEWTEGELRTLRDLARACATELRLRLARHTAETERDRAEALQDRLTQSLLRSQLLLTASQALSDVSSVNELRDRIEDLVAGDLKPARVKLIVTQDLGEQTQLEDQRDTEHREATTGQWGQFDAAGTTPAARAVRERRPVHMSDLRGADTGDAAAYLADGFVAVTCAPITDSTGVLGVLELAWDQPHEHDDTELAVIVTIAGYVAAALQRSRFLQHRISVAQDLQQAMLTDLPTLPGLRLAARYLPADTDEQVGGDWYDAFTLHNAIAVVVGDVTGHDLQAATDMGQVRAMLRQASWQEQSTGSPATAMTALDDAATGLGLDASGTAILAYLTPAEHGHWQLTWTNAGHPPPIVLHPDRNPEILYSHDHLLGYADTFSRQRSDTHRRLAPGSTVLLYTDGLVERPGADIDDMIENLAAIAAGTSAADPDHLADVVLQRTASTNYHDDVALLVIHIPEVSG